MVDQQSTCFDARQCAIGAEHDGAQIVVVAHTAKHHVRSLRGFAWRGGAGMTGKFSAPVFGFGRVAVVHGHMVAGQCQVASHGIAHDAQADEGDFGRGGSFVGFGVGAGHG